ncbi:MAG: helix-turn-helix-domain containing protein AraC type [Sphingobacteriaceae bacterium]|jgi:AraC family transcriptional regulator|nr:helix-turn-helix-domain containing protein AraC type [Sphingobacteriaceae bacterium]
MKTLKILQNHNKLYSETASDVFYPQQSGDFSMRLVFNGNESYNLGSRNLNVYPGSFLVVNEGTRYSRRIDSHLPANTFSLFFNKGFLQNFHQSLTHSDASLLDNPFISQEGDDPRFLETLYPLAGDLKFNLMHLKSHFDAGMDNEMLLNEYMHHSLLLYYKIYNREVIDKSNSLGFLNKQTKVEILKRLSVAKDYILSNFSDQITLEDLSRQACLSVNHLLRTFKQAFGCSPHQYLMRVRLMQAKFLLKNTDYPVNEIVDLIGFECSSSFIRLFKNTYQLTPRTFRNSEKGTLLN